MFDKDNVKRQLGIVQTRIFVQLPALTHLHPGPGSRRLLTRAGAGDEVTPSMQRAGFTETVRQQPGFHHSKWQEQSTREQLFYGLLLHHS